MRIRATVFYGDSEQSLSQETEEYSLHSIDEDPESFDEAQDYLKESVIEPYEDDGYELEEEEEAAVGTDYLAAWVIVEPFDTRGDAKAFLDQLILDSEGVLAELE